MVNKIKSLIRVKIKKAIVEAINETIDISRIKKAVIEAVNETIDISKGGFSLRILRREIELVVNEAMADLRKGSQMHAMFSTVEYILTNLPTVQSVDTKWKVHDIAIDNITIKDGIVAEFGVFSGESINYIAKKLPSFKVYGFDSFEGLPEPWRDGFDKGTFFLENLPKVENNVELVVGLFEETLPEFIMKEKRPLSYLHIDCDLYSSTKTVFEFLKDRIIEGTVIVFDEYFNYPGWQNGEYKAFQEFIKETGKKYKYLTYNYRWEQVAVKIV